MNSLIYEAIKQCVQEYLSESRDTVIDPVRSVLLDNSNGVVDGWCYLIFAREGELPVFVVKAAETEQGRCVYDNEHRNLLRLQELEMNTGCAFVPVPLGKWDIGGILVTLQTALQGRLMKNIPGKQIFSGDGTAETIGKVSLWLREFYKRTGIFRCQVDDKWYEEQVLLPMRRYLNRFLVSKAEERFLRDRLEERAYLIGREIPMAVRHGDFCTANIVLMEEGIGVFDWEFPMEHHIPMFDIFYFFNSLRFPYSGYRRESDHYTSFAEVYWGNSYFSEACFRFINEFCNRLEIPEEWMPDLFLISLLQTANMKYDGLQLGTNLFFDPDTEAEVSDNEKMRRWNSFGEPDMNLPFACIRRGVYWNIRHLAERGYPDFKRRQSINAS